MQWRSLKLRLKCKLTFSAFWLQTKPRRMYLKPIVTKLMFENYILKYLVSYLSTSDGSAQSARWIFFKSFALEKKSLMHVSRPMSLQVLREAKAQPSSFRVAIVSLHVFSPTHSLSSEQPVFETFNSAKMGETKRREFNSCNEMCLINRKPVFCEKKPECRLLGDWLQNWVSPNRATSQPNLSVLWACRKCNLQLLVSDNSRPRWGAVKLAPKWARRRQKCARLCYVSNFI